MIHFHAPGEYRSIDGGPWIYLGKDVSARLRIERELGSRPAALQGLLHAEMRRLRKPFLDFTADLGNRREDLAAWWAGILPWKAWGSSDFFLLAAYESLCIALAGSGKPLGADSLHVIVEDPWLRRQLRGALDGKPGVSFSSTRGLWPARLKAAAGGVARRIHWALRILRSWAAQRSASRGRRPGLPAGNGILLYSYLQDRSLDANGGWKDFFLPGCFEELRKAGFDVRRFTYTDQTGYEKELAGRSSYVIPTILYGSLRGLFKALFVAPPRVPAAELSGMPVDWLLRREWWHDFSRTGRSSYLFFLDAARRLCSAAGWKAVLMPWEGQPPERMLIAAAKERGLRVVGYQHAPFADLQLTQFLGRGEADRGLLPDLILTSGSHALKLLEENGIPKGRLLLGGSRRHSYLLSIKAPSYSGKQKDVLVILPIERFHALHFLAAIAEAYPEGGRGFQFLIQPHPAEPSLADNLPFLAKVMQTPLKETLSSSGLVVFTGSTAGMEAWALGHPVLRYRPETLVDIDPCDVFDEQTLPTARESDLRQKIEALREAPPPSQAALDKALEDLFALPDERALLKAVSGGDA